MPSVQKVLLAIAAAALPLVSAAPPAANPACYTHTTQAYPASCTAVAGCFNVQCLDTETKTLPCPTKACAATPTVTETLACQTACRTGCATTTVHAAKTNCPKA